MTVKPAATPFAILCVVLLAMNLRTPLTSVGPLLGQIQASAGLSASAAGFLSTLPILTFAFASIGAARLGRRLGLERALFLSMIIVAVGIFIRSTPGLAPLFGGTVLLGAAIAVANVLVPSLVKQDFPQRIGTMTGLYTVVMTFASGLSAGLSVPLASVLPGGWRGSLAFWGLMSLAAAAFWFVRLRRAAPANAAALPAPTPAGTPVWRSLLGWQVTLFMGLQALNFYVFVSWLPSMVHDLLGLDPSLGGWLLALLQLLALTSSMVMPWLANRVADHRLLGLGTSLVCIVGIGGLALFPQWMLLWIAISGAGLGGSLVLSLAFIGMRTANAQQAAALSGMVQGVGYLVAAAGPVICGVLRDTTGSWTPALWFMVSLAALQCWAAHQSGRRRVIGDD